MLRSASQSGTQSAVNPVQAAFRALKRTGATVAVAESCTAGGLGWALTTYPGSSLYFVGGVQVYANAAKQALLGVAARALRTHGAVSQAVARAMARNVRARLHADYGVAITGIAGPDGGTAEKPVGLVWFAVAGPRRTVTRKKVFPGTRSAVRRGAVRVALELLTHELMQNVR
jgi:PncC family amidohydrolase